jgi:hypothetical protein
MPLVFHMMRVLRSNAFQNAVILIHPKRNPPRKKRKVYTVTKVRRRSGAKEGEGKKRKTGTPPRPCCI